MNDAHKSRWISLLQLFACVFVFENFHTHSDSQKLLLLFFNASLTNALFRYCWLQWRTDIDSYTDYDLGWTFSWSWSFNVSRTHKKLNEQRENTNTKIAEREIEKKREKFTVRGSKFVEQELFALGCHKNRKTTLATVYDEVGGTLTIVTAGAHHVESGGPGHR